MALRNFVNGEQVDAKDGRTSDVVDPSTGEPYDQAPLSGAADVDAAMTAAAAAFEEWRDATPDERSLAMLRIADAVEAKAEELVAGRVPQHRQAAPAHPGRGDRRRWSMSSGSSPAAPACWRAVGRGVHGRPHVA